MKVSTMLMVSAYLAVTWSEFPRISDVAKRNAKNKLDYLSSLLIGLIFWPLFITMALIKAVRGVYK